MGREVATDCAIERHKSLQPPTHRIPEGVPRPGTASISLIIANIPDGVK